MTNWKPGTTAWTVYDGRACETKVQQRDGDYALCEINGVAWRLPIGRLRVTETEALNEVITKMVSDIRTFDSSAARCRQDLGVARARIAELKGTP